jgi:cysteine desulfurase / selenocysteine lyase
MYQPTGMPLSGRMSTLSLLTDVRPVTLGPSARSCRDQDGELDPSWVRRHFDFVGLGRTVTNNAASTQPPRVLLERLDRLVREYENVHRGQSSASRATTERFEGAYDTIALWLNAPSRRSIVTYRNTTEANNAVMYQLLTELRDGDNVVTTMLEHNSNYVPWFALANEILPRFGRRVECRLVDFDPATGKLDIDHLASLVDARTKLVCCTGASNFFGTKPPLDRVREIASASGYVQPGGDRGSLLLVDGAQLAPSTRIDVQALDVDYLSFSFHKLLAPFGVGVLYAKEHLLESSLPFLYGGDMIAEGQVTPQAVGYNALPWKFAAGTPNILGVILGADALRATLDLACGGPGTTPWLGTERAIDGTVIDQAMARIGRHTRRLTELALERLSTVPGITIYGPPPGEPRSPLVAFNVQGWSPLDLAARLGELGVESRAGCHCATLAHHRLGLTPPASCRLSFALYNDAGDVERATRAVRWIVDRGARANWARPSLAHGRERTPRRRSFRLLHRH